MLEMPAFFLLFLTMRCASTPKKCCKQRPKTRHGCVGNMDKIIFAERNANAGTCGCTCVERNTPPQKIVKRGFLGHGRCMLSCLLQLLFFVTVSHLFSALVTSLVFYFPPLGSVSFVGSLLRFLKSVSHSFFSSLFVNLVTSLVFRPLPSTGHSHLSICCHSFVFTFPPSYLSNTF